MAAKSERRPTIFFDAWTYIDEKTVLVEHVDAADGLVLGNTVHGHGGLEEVSNTGSGLKEGHKKSINTVHLATGYRARSWSNARWMTHLANNC